MRLTNVTHLRLPFGRLWAMTSACLRSAGVFRCPLISGSM